MKKLEMKAKQRTASAGLTPAKGGEYKCAGCGERFLSLIELRAHRNKYKGPHRQPKKPEGKVKNIVDDIEGKIEEIRDRGYHGYRDVDRSS